MGRFAVDLTLIEEFLDGLEGPELQRVMGVIGLLEEAGPNLPEPYSKPIKGSRHKKMKELRIRYGDRHFRILYAFDTKRQACLLVAAEKAEYGFQEFYDDFIPIADDLLDARQLAIAAERQSAKKAKAPGKARSKRARS